MAKAGTEYQELVALVAKALDSNAEIKTGQWIEGPDGDREVDVEVHGTVDGKPHFILIECKDWKKRLDIQEMDKLDSKRRDLLADAAIIYSNSGFTKSALRKAERLGIDAVSAIVAGNRLIRPVLEREFFSKRLSVDSWNIILYYSESDRNFPDPWNARTLRFKGLAFVNWLRKLSLDLLEKHEGEPKIIAIAAFKGETPFTLEGVPVTLRGFRVEMTCSRKWLSQTVREDVSLGVYSHITRRLTIPSKQSWSIGWIDPEAWQEIHGEPPEPGSFRLDLIRFNPIAGFQDEETPPIDDLISVGRIDLPVSPEKT